MFTFACVLYLCFNSNLAVSAWEEKDVVLIRIDDPQVLEKAERENKEEEWQKEFRKNPFKRFSADLKETRAAFSRSYKPGVLTGAALSPGKHHKQAKAHVKNRQYFAAACSWLDALQYRNRKKFVKGLNTIAEKAYKEKLGLAQKAEEQGRFEIALEHYMRLGRYLNALDAQQMLTFSSLDMDAAEAGAHQALAVKYYSLGSEADGKNQWQEAVDAYRKVILHQPKFKNAEEKLAESLFAVGKTQLRNGDFDTAADTLLEASLTWPEQLEARRLASAVNYQLADYYFQNMAYRTALSRWEQLLTLDHGFLDTQKRAKEARALAEKTVSAPDFEYVADENINGDPQVLRQTLLASLREGASEFLVFDETLTEPQFTLTCNLRGFGVENYHTAKPDTFTERQYKHLEGKVYERTDTTITYQDHRLSRLGRIAGRLTLKHQDRFQRAYQLELNWDRKHRWTKIENLKSNKKVGTGGGLTLVNDIIQDANGTRKTVAQIQALNGKQPPPPDVMLEQMMKLLSAALADEILAFLDRDPPVDPPQELDLTPVDWVTEY